MIRYKKNIQILSLNIVFKIIKYFTLFKIPFENNLRDPNICMGGLVSMFDGQR